MTYAGSASDAKSFGPDTPSSSGAATVITTSSSIRSSRHLAFFPPARHGSRLLTGRGYRSSATGRRTDARRLGFGYRAAGTFKAMRVEINSNRRTTGSVSMRRE
jgi:hypothetical protein